MKIQFEERDIVVACSAYGHKIVRTEQSGEPVYLLVDFDEDMRDDVYWRGSFESCLAEMAKDMQAVALRMEPILRQPDEDVNGKIARVEAVA